MPNLKIVGFCVSLLIAGGCKAFTSKPNDAGDDGSCVPAVTLERVALLDGSVNRVGLSTGRCLRKDVGLVPVLDSYVSTGRFSVGQAEGAKALKLFMVDQTLVGSTNGNDEIVIGDVRVQDRAVKFAPGISLKPFENRSGQVFFNLVGANHGS